MEKPATQFDIFCKRIKDNHAIAMVMIQGTAVVVLALLTDTARSLFDWGHLESTSDI